MHLRLALFLLPLALFAADPVLNETFDAPALGKGWSVQNGDWTPTNGVLRVKELAADKHAASARRVIETTDAVYELRFRFVGKGTMLHFGFDPKRGSLKKKGHLFSVILTPDTQNITKHVDKNQPKQEPNEVFARLTSPLKRGEWHRLKVTTSGPRVVAAINELPPLEASHPTFSVPKPTLVFRCKGDGVEIDDVRVTPTAE